MKNPECTTAHQVNPVHIRSPCVSINLKEIQYLCLQPQRLCATSQPYSLFYCWSPALSVSQFWILIPPHHHPFILSLSHFCHARQRSSPLSPPSEWDGCSRRGPCRDPRGKPHRPNALREKEQLNWKNDDEFHHSPGKMITRNAWQQGERMCIHRNF